MFKLSRYVEGNYSRKSIPDTSGERSEQNYCSNLRIRRDWDNQNLCPSHVYITSEAKLKTRKKRKKKNLIIFKRKFFFQLSK